MKQPAYIGIDPGLTGCAALVTGRTKAPFKIEMFDFKTIEAAALQINIWRTSFNVEGVVLERPNLTGRGGKNLLSSKFIVNVGQWEGMLAAYYFTYVKVMPVTWQKKYKMLYPGSWQSKDRTLKVAGLIFPEMKNKIYLKKHNNRADALLIANYCRDLFSHGVNQITIGG